MITEAQTSTRSTHTRTGVSVNNSISSSAVTLVYTSLDSLFRRLCELGPGAFIWKMDLKRAFRHIVVCPDDTVLYGFYFNGVGYVDLRRLTFIAVHVQSLCGGFTLDL
ncbi:hypothetical protein B0H13DRAFT_2323403 [Mycena leptocephala]|nr:hypothetical protein B0H13DRAFT_2323403 [Mycena leptocephala]